MSNKITLPQVPKFKIGGKERYVATIYPEEGILFSVGTFDEMGQYLHMGRPLNGYDLDFELIGFTINEFEAQNELIDLGWHVVVDDD